MPLVNSSEEQYFTTGTPVTVTFLDTPARSLTAGNNNVVAFRGSVDPDNLVITDTAGNDYPLVGSVEVAGGRLFVFLAQDCLGHAANVVHAAFPAAQFVHVCQGQFSGWPTNLIADVVFLDQGAGSDTISIDPLSAHTNQLVIACADLVFSGHSTIAPAIFTLLGQSTYDGGSPVGIGSNDVRFNENSARYFSNGPTVTCTFFGGFETVAKQILVVILRQPITVETRPASSVTDTTAQLNGTVTPSDSSQDAFFRWDTLSPPVAHETAVVATIADSETPVAYSLGITGLTAGVQYYVRAVAVDDLGVETLGAVRSFIAGEAIFTDGEVSQPLTWFEWYHDDATRVFAEVDLNDRDTYYHGYKAPIVLDWKPVTRGLSDRAGQLEHLSFGATFSDTDRRFRGLLDTELTRYFPNRSIVERMIDDEERRLEGAPRIVANGFISTYAPEQDLQFSIECVDWLRRKYTRQRKSQLAWQPLVKPEDFDINITPQQVLNRPAPFPYHPDRDDDLQTVADSDRSTGYLPDPTAGGPTLTGAPANPVTKRFYFTALNGFYGDATLQRISDHRGETYYAAVDQSVPDDQELRDQVNGGTASTYCDFPISADAAATAVPVYAGDTDGANIKYLGLATDLGGGSFNYTYGKSPLGGGPLYTPGEEARPPARNNTYIPGTLSGGNVTTDPGSGMNLAIYTGLSRGLTDSVVRCQFLIAGCAVKGDFAVYVGGVRVPDAELDTYFVVPGRATWTAAYDSRQYLERFGRRYTTIDVDSVYATTNGLVAADRLAAGDTPLTVNYAGIEDVGDATGDEITNLFLQALHFADNAGPPDRPINAQGWVGASPIEFSAIPGLPCVDRDSFQALADAYPDMDGHGVLGAFQEEVGFGDGLARFCVSGDFQVGFNRKGQLIAEREPDEIPADVTVVDDVTNIVERSFRISDGVLSEFFNVLPYRYGRDLSGRTSGGPIFDWTRGVRVVLPDSDGWASTANGDTEVEDLASQNKFDQVVSAPQMDLFFVSDPTLARQIANRVLLRYSIPLRRVTFTVPLSGTSIDLGDVFKLTDIEGIGSSGYLREAMRCLRHELNANSNAVTIESYAISTIVGRVVTDDTFDPVTTEDGTDFIVVD